jgi:hypothetical protein
MFLSEPLQRQCGRRQVLSSAILTLSQGSCHVTVHSKSTVRYCAGMTCLLQYASCLGRKFSSCVGKRVSKVSANLCVSACCTVT